MPNTAERKCRATVKTTQTFQAEIKSPPTILNPKKTASWETAERQMTTREVCYGPRKAEAGGGEETRKNANNMRNREGKTKEREPGSESYGRYSILSLCSTYHMLLKRISFSSR
jgi:hypothetical protein